MNHDNATKESGGTVERLILQYKEYLCLADKIKKLEAQKLRVLVKISRKEGVPIGSLKANKHRDIEDLERLIELTKLDQKQVSDEMTFANPVVWIMYKDRAYRGTSQGIEDWAAFKEHCAPRDYICGKRFRFIDNYLKAQKGISLRSVFNDNLTLAKVYTSRLLLNLVNDLEFMEGWKRNEYRRARGRAGKWET
jgi:hypothetical protein